MTINEFMLKKFYGLCRMYSAHDNVIVEFRAETIEFNIWNNDPEEILGRYNCESILALTFGINKETIFISGYDDHNDNSFELILHYGPTE